MRKMTWSLKISSVREKWFQFFPSASLSLYLVQLDISQVGSTSYEQVRWQDGHSSQHGRLASAPHLRNVYLVCFRDVLVAHVKNYLLKSS